MTKQGRTHCVVGQPDHRGDESDRLFSLGGATLGAGQLPGRCRYATAITVGGYDTCALLSTENVKCWGQNAYGALGKRSTTNSDVPVAVKGLRGERHAAGEYHHTCAQLNTGTVECWGWNAWASLAHGTMTDSSVPVAVTGLSGVTAVAAGNGHSCALLSTRRLCAGDSTPTSSLAT